MSELAAWLVDHDLSEVESVLAESGIDRVQDLFLLTRDDLRELGLAVGPRNRLLEALGRGEETAVPALQPPPIGGALPAPPPPPFTWRRSCGEVVAEAIAEPLPLAPPPPLTRCGSSRCAPAVLPTPPAGKGTASPLPPPLPPPAGLPAAPAAPAPSGPAPQLVWRRSVEGVWEEEVEAAEAEGMREGGSAGAVPVGGGAECSDDDGIDIGGGWVAYREDGSDAMYYHHAESGETTWERPKPAASGGGGVDGANGASGGVTDGSGDSGGDGGGDSGGGGGWTALMTDEGERYFCHGPTGRTSWSAPAEWEEEAQAATSAAAAATETACAAEEEPPVASSSRPPNRLGRQASNPKAVAAAVAVAAASRACGGGGGGGGKADGPRRIPPPIPLSAHNSARLSAKAISEHSLPMLPTPPRVPAAAVASNVDKSQRSSLVAVDLLGETPLPPPVPPPLPPPPDASAAAAPPPFVWRRSNGEYLQDAQTAAKLGLPTPPPPTVPTAVLAAPVSGGSRGGGGGSEELTVTVSRNDYGLGLSFNDANVLVYIDPRGGAAAAGAALRLGDVRAPQRPCTSPRIRERPRAPASPRELPRERAHGTQTGFREHSRVPPTSPGAHCSGRSDWPDWGGEGRKRGDGFCLRGPWPQVNSGAHPCACAHALRYPVPCTLRRWSLPSTASRCMAAPSEK